MGASLKKAMEENSRILDNLEDKLKDKTLDEVKIVLIGPAGAGKSSFINNCFSAIQNIRLNPAPTGKSACITKRPVPYYLDVKDSPYKVILLDSRGYHAKVETKSMDEIIAGKHKYLELVPDGDNHGPEGEKPYQTAVSEYNSSSLALGPKL